MSAAAVSRITEPRHQWPVRRCRLPAALIGAMLLMSMALTWSAVARAPSEPIATIKVSALPVEARETLTLIRKGGPFPYRQDGQVFGNREQRLPNQTRGFYREYTVKTPGLRQRGARRIVCGGERQQTCYYTDDHYATFRNISE